MPMSRKIAEEVLPLMRQRYVGMGREGRSRLIDEVCEQWDYSRKHAIKLLVGKAGWGGGLCSRKGRPPVYGEAEAVVLWRIWKTSEQPCGKRLKALLTYWLPLSRRSRSRCNSAACRPARKVPASSVRSTPGSTTRPSGSAIGG